MNNPYGLINLWSQGDWVMRGVALLLLTMSVLSWYVMLMRGWHALRMNRLSNIAERSLRDAQALSDLGPRLEPAPDNAFRRVIDAATICLQLHPVMRARGDAAPPGAEWLASHLRQAIDDASARLQSSLGLLASISSTAPFIGLFGTVWGIYHALIGIGIAGQAIIEKVAGPVGEALIMTALGLAVAIPATFGYNAAVRNNKALLARLRRFSHDVYTFAITGMTRHLPETHRDGAPVHVVSIDAR